MYQPLADELRPRELSEVYGQDHILGEGAILRRIIDSGTVPNLIFYGPSGTGKTTHITLWKKFLFNVSHRLQYALIVIIPVQRLKNSL